MSPSRDRVTLEDVAKVVGVSTSAASLAIRGRAGVADDTRDRVRRAARELGYRPPVTRRGAPLESIGLVVKARESDEGNTNAFYGPVMGGVIDACRTAGIAVRLEMVFVDDEFEPRSMPDLGHLEDLGGLLILGTFVSRTTAAALGSLPTVLVDGYAEEPAAYPAIVSDNRGGTKAATERLIDRGHEAIALVGTHPSAFPSIRERRQGYADAMLEAGLPPFFVDGVHDDERGLALAGAAAARDRGDLTAFVAANDAVAIALLQELMACGANVPSDYSVVGFDDIAASGLLAPGLDTVGVDKAAMGRLALNLLEHRIADPTADVATTVMQTRQVERASIAEPRRRPMRWSS